MLRGPISLNSAEALNTRSWCLFRSSARHFALPLEAVGEIVEAEGMVPFPASPARVLGLCPYRRDIVPIVALGDKLIDRSPAVASSSVILIARAEQGLWGFPIDREGTLTTNEPFDPTGEIEAPGTIGRGGIQYTVIDPESAWRQARGAIEAWYHSSGSVSTSIAASHPAG